MLLPKGGSKISRCNFVEIDSVQFSVLDQAGPVQTWTGPVPVFLDRHRSDFSAIYAREQKQ